MIVSRVLVMARKPEKEETKQEGSSDRGARANATAKANEVRGWRKDIRVASSNLGPAKKPS